MRSKDIGDDQESVKFITSGIGPTLNEQSRNFGESSCVSQMSRVDARSKYRDLSVHKSHDSQRLLEKDK